MSGFEPAGSRLMPAIAIGSTNSVIRNRYSGNSHEAVRRCCSSTFSTTITWNSRGRQTTAAAARNVSVIQRGPNMSLRMQQVRRGARAKIDAGPSAMP